MKKKRIGERLVERGKLSAADLESVLKEQRGKTILLGELLLDRGLVTKKDLSGTLTEIFQVECVDVKTAEIDPGAAKLIPQRIAEQYKALPLRRDGKQLIVVMTDPQNLQALDQLRFSSGLDISPRLGFRDEIVEAIEKLYGASPAPSDHKTAGSPAGEAHKSQHASASPKKAEQVLRTSAELMHDITKLREEPSIQFETAKLGAPDPNAAALRELASAQHNQQTPAVRIFSSVVGAAIREGASDIHIDPQTNGAVVRIRVDGMLRDLMDVPLDVQASLISRIKILGGMDIAERRAPQDGRVLVRSGDIRVDLRVSTLPTQHGEKAVIRLLNPQATKVDFTDLGLSQRTADGLRKIITQPQGMLLVTGPTGSGKTTTLYAALNQIRARTKNIITVEDPVEYMLEGINQVQVNAKAGRTFANCLRSILRQDPNVIMIGEIRDLETAEIALSSSQTGHMVLSTLHTNDSVSAIVRLLDLGIPSFLIASSLSAVIAQRLLRRLCTCRQEAPLSPQFAALLLSAGVTDFGDIMYVPVGCDVCQNTGYKGRVGVYEILFVNEQTRSAIRSGGNPDEIRRMARTEGMRLMQEEAIDKAKVGVTSLEEIFRVIPFESIPPVVRCATCKRDVASSFLFCPHCGADRRTDNDNIANTAAAMEREIRV